VGGSLPTKRDKRAGESDHQAFARVFENPNVRKAWLLSKAYPDVMITQPVSVETGNTTVESDADEAARQIA
jgi:hypothetical protein